MDENSKLLEQAFAQSQGMSIQTVALELGRHPLEAFVDAGI